MASPSSRARGSAARRTDPLGVGTPADREQRWRLVFSGDEIAAMDALRRAALDVILASLAREGGLAFLREHAAAIRTELAWVATAPPRLLPRAFSRERLRAHERRRRVLRVVPSHH